MTRRIVAAVLVLSWLVLSWLLLGSSPATAADCAAQPTGLTPLSDLGLNSYQGEMGGLYPDGSNEVPPEYLAAGLSAAENVVPRDATGAPDPEGSIVMISIGVSNTLAEFNGFISLAEGDPSVSPALAFINGGQVGRALNQWATSRSDAPWQTLDSHLSDRGFSEAQVQVAWVKLPSRSRGPATLEDARGEVALNAEMVRKARERFPNLALVYFSSRTYGGYIADADSEPNAYHHGFVIKWLVEDWIRDHQDGGIDDSLPWIAWGPYLWADGSLPREDGLTWECADFRDDGVHPGPGVESKVGAMLMEHFTSHPTSVDWFTAEPGAGPPPATAATSTTQIDRSDRTDRNQQSRTTEDREGRRNDQTGRGQAAPEPPRLNDESEATFEDWPLFIVGLVLGSGAGSIVAVLWHRRLAMNH